MIAAALAGLRAIRIGCGVVLLARFTALFGVESTGRYALVGTIGLLIQALDRGRNDAVTSAIGNSFSMADPWSEARAALSFADRANRGMVVASVGLLTVSTALWGGSTADMVDLLLSGFFLILTTAIGLSRRHREAIAYHTHKDILVMRCIFGEVLIVMTWILVLPVGNPMPLSWTTFGLFLSATVPFVPVWRSTRIVHHGPIGKGTNFRTRSSPILVSNICSLANSLMPRYFAGWAGGVGATAMVEPAFRMAVSGKEVSVAGGQPFLAEWSRLPYKNTLDGLDFLGSRRCLTQAIMIVAVAGTPIVGFGPVFLDIFFPSLLIQSRIVVYFAIGIMLNLATLGASTVCRATDMVRIENIYSCGAVLAQFSVFFFLRDLETGHRTSLAFAAAQGAAYVVLSLTIIGYFQWKGLRWFFRVWCPIALAVVASVGVGNLISQIVGALS